jgi:2-methylcitrate dehydratase PrpD
MDPIELFVKLAQDLSPKDLNQKTIDSVKSLLIDFMGVMLAGTNSRISRTCADLVSRWGGQPEATVFANGKKVPLPFAVLANCAAGRELDYDDIHARAHLHATVGIVPPALAISETIKIDGLSFVTAIVVAYELHTRLGIATTEVPPTTGMSTTYQGASLAAALVCSKLLKYDADRTRNALGNAYSQLAGIQQVLREGTDMMVVQQGLSGMSGVLAAELARVGISGPKEIMTGRYGYFPIFHPDRHDIDKFVEGLGKSWEIENTSIKPFPNCGLNHTGLEALVELKRNHSFKAEEIVKVEIGLDSHEFEQVTEPVETKRNPKTIVDAIYSLPYALSVFLSTGKIGLRDYTIEALGRPEVLEFVKKIEPFKDPTIAKRAKGSPSRVRIFLKDGRKLESYKDVVKGGPSSPMNKDELKAKFFDCLDFAGYPSEVGRSLLDSLEHIEDIRDVSDIVNICRKAIGSSVLSKLT